MVLGLKSGIIESRNRGKCEIILPRQNCAAEIRMITGFLKPYFSTLQPLTFQKMSRSKTQKTGVQVKSYYPVRIVC